VRLPLIAWFKREKFLLLKSAAAGELKEKILMNSLKSKNEESVFKNY